LGADGRGSEDTLPICASLEPHDKIFGLVAANLNLVVPDSKSVKQEPADHAGRDRGPRTAHNCD